MNCWIFKWRSGFLWGSRLIGKRIKDISFVHKPLPFLNLNMIFISTKMSLHSNASKGKLEKWVNLVVKIFFVLSHASSNWKTVYNKKTGLFCLPPEDHAKQSHSTCQMVKPSFVWWLRFKTFLAWLTFFNCMWMLYAWKKNFFFVLALCGRHSNKLLLNMELMKRNHLKIYYY